jgi:shikimate dehydrogenase
VVIYGLIGFPLSHSWSADWFSDKFLKENITDKKYLLFPLERLTDLPDLIRKNPDIKGLNITIPYKERIIDYLDEMDETAQKIGAVNTIQINHKEGIPVIKGYNTDAEGFRLSMDFSGFNKALILGTGGASKAVAFILKNQGIDFLFVSRNPVNQENIHYSQITEEIMHSHSLIINSTPLGMYPDTDSFPPIPYQWVTGFHFLYDLVYNPELTLFLEKGQEHGATIQNGKKMLQLQAEKSFEIWETFHTKNITPPGF